MAARTAINGWAEGAEILELLRAADKAGWLERLRAATTADELAGDGRSAEQVANALSVLVAANVVRAEDGVFQLVPAFEALVGGASGMELSAVLTMMDISRGRVASALEPTADGSSGLDAVDALALARFTGVRPDEGARQLYGLLYQVLPDVRKRLEQGGPMLDVGSGVGGAVLTALSVFDRLRAVAVEIVPEVAAELSARAQQAGVSDRLEVRAVNAAELQDESTFEVCFWAQPFFTAEVRSGVLAAVLRALRPDGILIMQELFPPVQAQDSPTARAYLDQLFYRQLGLSYGLSAEDLAAEAKAAGFQDPEIAASPLGRLVTLRKPAD
jgi:SAM-dependent methyltransferase